MKLIRTALCATAAMAAMSGVAAAQTSVNAGAVTEYIYRGLSQTSGATAFGGVDWASDNFYIGAWASGVSFADAEVDLYAGWTPSAGGLDLDFAVIYYGYVDAVPVFVDHTTGLADPSIDAAFFELKAAATLPIGMGSLTGSINYSPDFFAESGAATYYELGFSFPWETVSFSGAIGLQTIDEVEAGPFACLGAPCQDSYTTWNFGMTIPVGDNFSVDVRYINTDSDADYFGNSNLAGVARDGIFGTLTAVFPAP